MIVNIHPDTLKNLISQAKFSVHGDVQERKYCGLFDENFPNCEEFWRQFVVPLTRRVLPPNEILGKDIGFRDGIDDELRQIASVHYSIFMHLVYAYHHIEMQGVSWIENLYAHLGTICDLVETVMERWYLVQLKCDNEQSKILERLTREEFLDLAGEAFDADYENAYQHYLSKGRFMTIEVPKGDNLLKEYLGDTEERKEYSRLSLQIRTYRNIMVHDIKLGRVQDENSIFIPKLNVVGKYRTWKAVEEATKNKDTLHQDFMEQSAQGTNSLEELEICLNTLWGKLIQDVSEEFFSAERDQLRQLARINFLLESAAKVLMEEGGQPAEDLPYTSESGTYPPPGVYLPESPTDNSAYFTSTVVEVDKNDD